MFVPPDDYITEEAGLMDFKVPGMTIRCALGLNFIIRIIRIINTSDCFRYALQTRQIPNE